jgi:hypothetical protein
VGKEKEVSLEEEQHYDFQSIKSEWAFKEAERLGQIVVLPLEDQLFVDLDSEEALQTFNKNLPKFELHMAEVKSVTRRPSRNGNTHAIVTLYSTMEPNTRILYQLFLGSDPLREMLSMIRYENGDKHPTLFIEKYDQLQLAGAPEQKLLTD